MLWHRDTALPEGIDLVVLPGGFSYGDYLRCGAMAAQSPIMRAIKDFAERGGHVLGVCNGFQMLTEAGLLPGALLRNATLRFLSMDCHMRVERADTPYTNRFQRGAGLPLDHGAWRRQLLRRRRDARPRWRARTWWRCATRRRPARSPRPPTATAAPAASPASSRPTCGCWG